MKIATGLWILLGIVWIGLYWPLLAGRVPAFRDAFHFYYPLEVWLDQQARQGDFFPQFNPLDGTGANLVGEMSTGLFYPGRCLWWLPGFSVAQRLGLVLLIHTGLAGLGAAYAARRLGLSAAPQLLAATAYSLSGPVFFQHVNPIFLISSAWLPWALAECCVLARGGANAKAKGFSTPTPTPSTSTSTSTMAMAMAMASRSRSRSMSRKADADADAGELGCVRWGVWVAACSLMLLGGDPQGTLHCGLIAVVACGCSAWSTRSLGVLVASGWRLALAVLTVAGLTAIQFLPTWYWYQAASVEPNVADSITIDGVPELLKSIAPATYDVARGSPYAYSVAPWHLVTLVWSNLLGQFLPEHTRYLTAWSAEPRMWTASLSIGFVSLLLSVTCFSMRQVRQGTRYLWLIVFLSGTAMLGNYAPVWMLRSGLRWFDVSTDWLPGDEVGGTYWLLTQWVPGYEAFRYPAKWTPLFAASLTLCAAHGLNNWEQTRSIFVRTVRGSAILCMLLSVLAGALVLLPVARESFATWVNHAQPDGWLNSIDANASLGTIMKSLAMACAVSLLAWLAINRLAMPTQPWLLVCLVMLELGWSAHYWLVTTPAASITVNVPPGKGGLPTRIWAAAGQASIMRDQPVTDALADKLQYQQQFALAKLHLLEGRTSNLSAFLTLTPKALAQVRHHLAQHDRLSVDDDQLDRALAWLGVQWRLVRSDRLRWHAIEPASPCIELLGKQRSENTLHVKYFSPARIGLHIEAASQKKLLVRLFQDGGWRAVLRDEHGASQTTAPKASHLGLFQALDVPAGSWEIELQYQAPGFLIGAWISGATLATLLCFGLIRVYLHKRTSRRA